MEAELAVVNGLTSWLGKSGGPLLLLITVAWSSSADASAAPKEQLLCSARGVIVGKVLAAKATPRAASKATSTLFTEQEVELTVHVKAVLQGSRLPLVKGENIKLFSTAINQRPFSVGGLIVHCKSENSYICVAETGLDLTEQETSAAYVGKTFYFTDFLPDSFDYVRTWLPDRSTAKMWVKVCRTSPWHMMKVEPGAPAAS